MPIRGARAAIPRGGRGLRRMTLRLARRLRRLRAQRGWSRRAAAAHIGVGVPVVRRLENGEANPSLAVLVSVARAFGVPLRELLQG
jgi:XRE family transcriptional regulator, aerobic/anaerobic benzoate catabolism transcriptional regulator